MSRARPSSRSRTNSALRSSSAILAIRSFAAPSAASSCSSALSSASSRSIATSRSAAEHSTLPGPLYALLGLCAVYRSYTLEGDQEHPLTRAHGAVCVLLQVSGPDQIEQAAVEGFRVHAKTLRRSPRVHGTTRGFSQLLPHHLQ